MKTVTILYFAAAREITKCSEERRVFNEGATLQSLLDQLVVDYSGLAELLPYVRVAVDEQFESDLARVIEPGCTIALIPPVSGGSWNYIVEHPIDPNCVAEQVYADDCGAVVLFTGRVRNHTGANQVLHLDYECYGSMAQRMLAQLISSVMSRYPHTRIAVQHRVGHLQIGEIAVAVAVASPHRKNAFEACQTFIDELKADIPIFKKESRTDGSAWVGMGG